jgi:predicted transcriptional regulator
MHKMSATMHKNTAMKILTHPRNPGTVGKENDPIRNKDNSANSRRNVNIDTKMNQSKEITVLDIEKETRLSSVISLYSKGLNQEEIAHELHIDQSTVSRDLHFIKQEAKKQVEKYLREDILFEYLRYMAGSNEITRKLWQIVENESATTKEKTNALAQLMQSYNSRLQTLTACPESYMNIKKSLSEIDLQRRVDSDSFLKAQVEHKKLFPHGFIGFRK